MCFVKHVGKEGPPMQHSPEFADSQSDSPSSLEEGLFPEHFSEQGGHAPYEDAQATPKDRERGATLMFALAILALLVLFSTVFARLMSIERRASAYYRDRVRSKLAARAGIERAIVELRAVAGQNHYSDPYKGRWKYHADAASRPTDLPPNEIVDLLTTTYPSFRQVHPDAAVKRWGDTLTYSGYLGQPDDSSHMIYRLKIIDSGSQLNLNHPDQRTANRLLKNLLVETFADANDGGDPAVSGIPQDLDLSDTQAQQIADVVIPLMSSGTSPTAIEQVEDRFRSKPQLGAAIIEAAVGISLDRELVENEWVQHLRDKVTVYSWEDPDVIRPYGLNTLPAPGAPTPAGYVQADARRNLPLMARAPINLNTASAPVLFALFADLQAKTRYGTFTIDATTARALATKILARRADPLPTATSTAGYTPFKSWPEFEAWLDDPLQNDIFAGLPTAFGDRLRNPAETATGLPTDLTNWAPDPTETVNGDEGLMGALQRLYHVGHRDLIKAQLNPNTMLNKYGALPTHGGNRRRYARVVDKSDLTHMTTEGCFDSLGVFEITSTGLIITRDLRDLKRGHLVSAGHTDLVVVRVYSPFRLTTQSQFEKHRANMVKGNFIVSPEKQDASKYAINDAFTASVNREYFRTTTSTPPATGITDPNHMNPGWAGMVSWPQYSLKRIDSSADSEGANKTFRYPLYDSANPATWDGHLTLSNMITVRTGDNDFVAGFSRGKLEAFKVRAWWEPKDIDPAGQYRTPIPTRPAAGGDELAYLANPLTRTTQAPALVDANGQESVLAEDFTNAAMTMEEAAGMFTEGASLLNTGVMIGPDRGSRFLAYDSNNIDLKQGTSIRFWVQPLVDPYSIDKEMLFYFNGSNGSKPGNQAADPNFSGWNVPTRDGTNAPETTPRHGNEQQAGFAVYKEYDSITQKIVIRLEDLGTAAHAYAQNSTVSIDVTPSLMLDASGSDELSKPDPAKPEWIPGSWHWIVINIGPGQFADGDPRRTAFASLQVDKVTVSVTDTKQLFRGAGILRDNVSGASTGHLGEVHAYYEQHGDSDISNFVSAVHAGNSTDAGNVFWRIYPRQLGDFYHCTQYDPLSGLGPFPAVAGTAPEGGTPHGRGTVSYRRTVEFGAPGESPAIQWDGSTAWYWYDWTAGSEGWYEQGAGWPTGDFFPALCTNRALDMQFYSGSGAGAALAGVTPMPFVFTGTGWEAQWPPFKYDSNYPQGVPSPFGAEGPGDYAGAPTPTGVDRVGLYEGPHPGGPSEWHKSVTVAWDEVHYLGRSPWAAAPWVGGGGYQGGWLPTDLSTLDLVDHPDAVVDPARPDPDWEARGGRLPYALDTSARHNKNTSMTTQIGSPTTALPLLVDGTFPGFIRGRSAMSFPNLSGGVVALDAVDDDCHGCEDCDLDGPVLFGAEPDTNTNYNGAALSDPNLDTMAVAVFDNIVFVNQDADRRTDFPGITSTGGDLFGGVGGTVSLVAKDFEDRFYEEDLAQYLDTLNGGRGTGAVFHRGLLELRNRQFRLASMTWTSYPTRVTNLDFEVALWKIDNGIDISGEVVYRYSNEELINEDVGGGVSRRDRPDLGDFSNLTRFATDPGKGAVFGHPEFAQRKLAFLTDFFQPNNTVDTNHMLRSPYVDGLGSVSAGIDPELLILGVRLQGYTNTHLDDTDPLAILADPDNPAEATPDQGVLVSPVLETPVFEDVTLNLTFPRPQYLYAEEGAIE